MPMKYIKLGVALFLIIAAIITAAIILNNVLSAKMVEDSKRAADVIISFYKPNPKDVEGFNKKLTEQMNGCLTEFKAKDDAVVAIKTATNEASEAGNQSHDSVMPEVEFDPDAPASTQPAPVKTVQVVLEDTKGVTVSGDNQISIKVNDLSFSDNGYAEVIYKGVRYGVYKQDVPETYQAIINNPVYTYKFYKTMVSKGVIEVYYKSIIDDNVLKVISFNNKGYQLTGFSIVR